MNYKIILQQGLMMTSGSCCGVPTGAGAGYLREDTAARKVYWRDAFTVGDSLLYDFNANIGDTLKGLLNNCGITNLTVQSIDSILIEASYRRRINYDISPFFPCESYSIIEGIGGTAGLTNCYFGYFEMGSELTCFSQNGNVIYSYACNPDSIPCGNLPSTINDYYFQNLDFTVFPNPALDELNISFKLQESSEVKFQLFNSLGQVVKEIAEEKLIAGENKIKISVEDSPEGLYYLKIRIGESESVKKVIKIF